MLLFFGFRPNGTPPFSDGACKAPKKLEYSTFLNWSFGQKYHPWTKAMGSERAKKPDNAKKMHHCGVHIVVLFFSRFWEPVTRELAPPSKWRTYIIT